MPAMALSPLTAVPRGLGSADDSPAAATRRSPADPARHNTARNPPNGTACARRVTSASGSAHSPHYPDSALRTAQEHPDKPSWHEATDR